MQRIPGDLNRTPAEIENFERDPAGILQISKGRKQFAKVIGSRTRFAAVAFIDVNMMDEWGEIAKQAAMRLSLAGSIVNIEHGLDRWAANFFHNCGGFSESSHDVSLVLRKRFEQNLNTLAFGVRRGGSQFFCENLDGVVGRGAVNRGSLLGRAEHHHNL